MSQLQQSLQAGKFVVTGEIGPPKGIDTTDMQKEIDHLKGHVVAINVTDIQSSVMRLGSLAVSARLVQMGVEPVYQVTCRDRNRLALQSDLLSAAWMGVENVLCLTGDHPLAGDPPGAKPVYDLDSVSLLQVVGMLEAGKDMAGNPLTGVPKFFRGCVVAPAADPLEPQLMKLEKKVAAGAQYIQTQAVYDARTFETFANEVAKRGIKVPVLAGIVFLKSPAMAKFMNEHVGGITVPEPLIKEMADTKKEDRRKKSAEIAARLAREFKPLCQGIHLMPLGWTDIVPSVISQAGL